MSQIFLGILSGTSMDAIDVAAVDFGPAPFKLLGTHSEPYPSAIRQALNELCQPTQDEINRCLQLDHQLGLLFANACKNLLKNLDLPRQEVTAIGSHGQTIRHQPLSKYPFTLQIGDPNVIAEMTGITTIADFRRRDLACGGQGAPLTPAFHHFAFHSETCNRVVVNIGGIANVTLLPANPSQAISGFDSGPGNTLLDSWILKHLGVPFDNRGNWAKHGKPDKVLLEKLLGDSYFQLAAPKSTGTDYFNIPWLLANMANKPYAAQDIQSTLAELTARSIMDAISHCKWDSGDILVCGGGVHNHDLIMRLEQKKSEGFKLLSTAHFGVNPNWVEAIAFAWLARQTFNRLTGNLPEVTGAMKRTILGGIYQVLES